MKWVHAAWALCICVYFSGIENSSKKRLEIDIKKSLYVFYRERVNRRTGIFGRICKIHLVGGCAVFV